MQRPPPNALPLLRGVRAVHYSLETISLSVHTFEREKVSFVFGSSEVIRLNIPRPLFNKEGVSERVSHKRVLLSLRCRDSPHL